MATARPIPLPPTAPKKVAGRTGVLSRLSPANRPATPKPHLRGTMQSLNSFLHQYGNSVVFGSALLEESGLPIPATPVFVAAGMAAGAGDMNLTVILGLAFFG